MIQDVIFVKIDDPDGSMKGEHKRVGKCFSLSWNIIVSRKLMRKEINSIVMTS